MNRTSNSFVTQWVACSLVACFAISTAFAAGTDISNVPLASGTPLPPNVLFTLDNSGSMDFDFLPDNVDPAGFTDLGVTSTSPANPCMTDSNGSTFAHCERGEPPHEAGGSNGSNGVSYDPTLRYLPGVTSTGALKLNAGTTPPGSFTPFTAVPNDAYGTTPGTANLVTGSGVIITGGGAGAFDKRYCNSAGTPACRRNGATDATAAVITAAGVLDTEGNSMTAGQFPYRANVSSSSVRSFGMPEMMTTGNFGRSATTVTVTTPGKPVLAVNDLVWVSTSAAALNVTCTAVKTVGANSFTYLTGSSGTVAATAGVYRKCGTGTWTRPNNGTTITVTITSGDGLQTNDQLIIDSDNNNQDKTSAVAVTVSGNTFTYTGSNNGTLLGSLVWVRTGLYNVLTAAPSPVSPTAYTITPIEYCSDVNLTTCVEVIPPAAPPAGFNPAYVRFCKTQVDAIAPGAISGSSGSPATARCQAKYTNTSGLPLYQFARYGRFNRESIISSTLTPNFGNRPARTDCAAVPVCSYAEEMENFSRWYTYYRTRMQMMKTAAGRAFQTFVSNPSATPPRPDTLRVGFITINSPTSNYLRITNFNATQAASWYNVLYNTNPGGGTPLREALSRAGWIFAGKMNTGLTSGIPAADDPMQASCQRNFSILTTDGFWNGNAGQTLSGATIGNLDSTLSAAGTDRLVSREGGVYDGGSSLGATGTLADVAQYYFQTDLRGTGAGPLTSPSTTPAGGDVSTNDVPAQAGNKDFLTTQHMVTFTLGLADGLMRYDPNYETASSGDFFNIAGATSNACFWAPGLVCNWPVPAADNPSALDDLWHAAVNGRGTFYQALNANALAQSLSNTLGNLNAQTAAAAASATSSPNITQTDNQIFSTTYQTNTWSGKVFAQTIDPVTGNVNPAIQWQADDRILSQTGPSSDTRRILMLNPLTNGLMDFTWANIQANTVAGTEKNFFQNKCSSPAPNAAMTQCGSLTTVTKAIADSGANMIGFLRGQSANESGPGCLICAYRDRQELDPVTNAVTQTVFGDTINAKPAFVRAAIFDYADAVTPTYASFQTSMASRAPRLYVGANDGYLHSFNANTGDEVWAYAPRFLLPGLYQLADTAYSANHRFYVDGSPETGDVFDVSAGAWKTILVGGAGAGGRGFYALNVTSETNPLPLWEFCADSTLCTRNDPDLGLSYGNPVIGKRASDGKWVVVLSSGLNNNVNSGTGGGFFFVLDAITGSVLNKIPTQLSGANVGTLGTPSGLMKIAGYYDNALEDATFTYVYGGDQLGNIWRMDMTVSPPTVLHIAALKDAAARAQPITTRMALTHIGANRVLYQGTGRYLGASDLSDPGAASGIAFQQSIYAIKDKVINAATDYGNIRTGGNLVVQTLTNASSTTRTTSTLPVDWNTKDGWMIDLNPGNTSPGERINVDPELIIGTLVIASNIPTTSAACTVGGNSFLYQFDFKTGQYVLTSLNNVAGQLLGGLTVGMAIVQLPSGTIKDIVTTADTRKVSPPVNIGAATAYIKRFSYRER